MSKRIEKIKITAEDENWEVVVDRPEDYFLRITNHEFTADIYYSKKQVVRLKYRTGENKYLYYMSDEKIEKMLKNPWDFYKEVSYMV